MCPLRYILIFLSALVALSLAIYSFYKADSESSSLSSFDSKSSKSSQSFWRTFVEWSSGIYLYKVFFGKKQEETLEITEQTNEEQQNIEGETSTQSDNSCATEARKNNSEGEQVGELVGTAEVEPGTEGERAS